jgi:hypothetical protein
MKSYKVVKVEEIMTLVSVLTRKVAHVSSNEVRIILGLTSMPDSLAHDSRRAMLQVQDLLEDLNIAVNEWLQNRDIDNE